MKIKIVAKTLGKEKQKKIKTNIHAEDKKLLQTSDWLMCACQADIVNMKVLFINSTKLL